MPLFTWRCCYLRCDISDWALSSVSSTVSKKLLQRFCGRTIRLLQTFFAFYSRHDWRNNKSRNSLSGCQKRQIIKIICKGLPSTSFLRNAGKPLYSAENAIPKQYEFWHSHRWSTWFINLVFVEKIKLTKTKNFFGWHCIFSRLFSKCSKALAYDSGFQTGGCEPKGSWTIFGGVATRCFMHTAVLHLLYSSFDEGRWVILIVDWCVVSRYKKAENCCLRT